MGPKRVLHCIASIDPSCGGPVSVLRGLCRTLSDQGVENAILTASTGDKENDRRNRESFQGVEKFIWAKPIMRGSYWDPFLALRLRNELHRYDTLHIHGTFNGVTYTAAVVARTLNIPYMLEPFGTLTPYCLDRHSFIKQLALKLGERSNIEKASKIRFASPEESRLTKLNFAVPQGVEISHGLDWEEFRHLPKPGAFRERYKIAPGEIVFTFVGRIHPIKGLDLFIPAFMRWTRTHPKVLRFIITGAVEKKDHLQHLKMIINLNGGESHILFTGPLYGADRIRAMVDSDAVVLTSFHESFGLSAAEGMACAKPVLVSDQVSLAPFVEKLNLGVVTPMNTHAMIDALETLYARREDWPSMGKKARNWAREHCRWDKIAPAIAKEY